MYDTARRVELVKQRTLERRRRREKRRIYRLSALCVALLVGLAGTLWAVTVGGGTQLSGGAFGSMLLYEDAGGYVLVGVIAFSVAVVITVLCMKYKAKIKQNDIKEEEKP